MIKSKGDKEVNLRKGETHEAIMEVEEKVIMNIHREEDKMKQEEEAWLRRVKGVEDGCYAASAICWWALVLAGVNKEVLPVRYYFLLSGGGAGGPMYKQVRLHGWLDCHSG